MEGSGRILFEPEPFPAAAGPIRQPNWYAAGADRNHLLAYIGNRFASGGGRFHGRLRTTPAAARAVGRVVRRYFSEKDRYRFMRCLRRRGGGRSGGHFSIVVSAFAAVCIYAVRREYAASQPECLFLARSKRAYSTASKPEQDASRCFLVSDS